MSEQELKLNIPMTAREGVKRDMARRDARSIRLRAMYFDTPTRELARARIALRLRLEDDTWVQTLKMPGADAITRLELNHQRPGAILDLSVYAGTEVETALSAIKGELGLRYETDVTRVVRKVRVRQGTVELAYDNGQVRAGEFTLPICELEFELLSGDVAAIFDVARTWHQRHGLVLDPRSKSERGDALASLAADLGHEADYRPHSQATLSGEKPEAASDNQGRAAQRRQQNEVQRRAERIAAFWAPCGMKGVDLKPNHSPSQAMARVSAECLDQIARNAATLAEVDTEGVYQAGGPEHVHQLRIGVRRLRSAWKLFDGIAVLPPAALQEDVKHHFSGFGANRDRDVQQATVLPLLQQAGMPDLPDDEPVEGDDSATLARSKAFQSTLLALLEWSVTPQPSLASVMAAAQALAAENDAHALESDQAFGSHAASEEKQRMGALPANVSGALAANAAAAQQLIDAHTAAGVTAAREDGVATLNTWHANAMGDGGTDASIATGDMGVGSGQAAARQTDGAADGSQSGSADGAAQATSSMDITVPTIIPLHAISDADDLRTLLLARLRDWHRSIVKRGVHFDTLEVEKKHALRKRVKLLRYGLAFCAPLLSAKGMRDYRKPLARVQDVLGVFNDLAVAHDYYLARSEQHGGAWFAVGWTSARQGALVPEAQAAFKALGAAPAFWK